MNMRLVKDLTGSHLPLYEKRETKRPKKLFLETFEGLLRKARETYTSSFVLGVNSVEFSKYSFVLALIAVWNLLEAIPVVKNIGQINVLHKITQSCMITYAATGRNYLPLYRTLCSSLAFAYSLLEEYVRKSCDTKKSIYYFIKYSFLLYMTLTFMEYFLAWRLMKTLYLVKTGEELLLSGVLLGDVYVGLDVSLEGLKQVAGFYESVLALNIVSRINALVIIMLCVAFNKLVDTYSSHFAKKVVLKEENKNLEKHFIKSSLNTFGRILGRGVLFCYLVVVYFFKLNSPMFLFTSSSPISPFFVFTSVVLCELLCVLLCYVSLRSFLIGHESFGLKEDSYKFNKRDLMSSFYVISKNQFMIPYNFYKALTDKVSFFDSKHYRAGLYGLLNMSLNYHSLFKSATDLVVLRSITRSLTSHTFGDYLSKQVFIFSVQNLFTNAVLVFFVSLVINGIAYVWKKLDLNTNTLAIVFTSLYACLLTVIPFLSSMSNVTPNMVLTLWVSTNLTVRVTHVRFFLKEKLSPEMSELSNISSLNMGVYASVVCLLMSYFDHTSMELVYKLLGLAGSSLILLSVYLNEKNKKTIDLSVLD